MTTETLDAFAAARGWTKQVRENSFLFRFKRADGRTTEIGVRREELEDFDGIRPEHLPLQTDGSIEARFLSSEVSDY